MPPGKGVIDGKLGKPLSVQRRRRDHVIAPAAGDGMVEIIMPVQTGADEQAGEDQWSGQPGKLVVEPGRFVEKPHGHPAKGASPADRGGEMFGSPARGIVAGSAVSGDQQGATAGIEAGCVGGLA